MGVLRFLWCGYTAEMVQIRWDRFLGVLGVAVLALLLMSCARASRVTVIRLAHGLPVGHPVHEAMAFMAQRVAEKSGGAMRVDIYPAGQLGEEREYVELLQIGSVGMTKVSAAVLESFAPSYKVLSLPYLYEDRAHRFAVWEGPVGKEILADGEQYYLRGLCFYDAGERSFYTVKKPVRVPGDLKGLKIRVQPSPTAVSLVNAFGASATPIAWGELYTALQQGTVDGAENNPPSFVSSNHFQVARYYTLNGHTAVPDVLIIGTKAWGALTDQERVWLQEAADESAVKQKALWEAAEAAAMATVREAGVEVIVPERGVFAAKVEGVLEGYRNDARMWGLIERIRAAGKGEGSR